MHKPNKAAKASKLFENNSEQNRRKQMELDIKLGHDLRKPRTATECSAVLVRAMCLQLKFSHFPMLARRRERPVLFLAALIPANSISNPNCPHYPLMILSFL